MERQKASMFYGLYGDDGHDLLQESCLKTIKTEDSRHKTATFQESTKLVYSHGNDGPRRASSFPNPVAKTF